MAGTPDRSAPRGRGTGENPTNRFEGLSRGEREYVDPEDEPSLRTELFDDQSKTVIAENDSPDLGMQFTLNPYRGCEHGCAYCYARPFHEYLGLSSGIDFETKIFVKRRAPELLRKELLAAKWQGEPISLSGVTDPYQPIERSLRITRGCLEVLREFQNPFGVVTKNHLITRDLDLFASMAKIDAAAAFVSVTTLDAKLAATLEPRASTPSARLRAIAELSAAGVPTGVLVAPVIPGLTDYEMPKILEAAAKAGARHAGYVLLRLPYEVESIFVDWLDRNAPDRKEKVLSRLRDLRGGKLYDASFETRMTGSGVFADQLGNLFRTFTKRYGLNEKRLRLDRSHFSRPGEQMAFDL